MNYKRDVDLAWEELSSGGHDSKVGFEDFNTIIERFRESISDKYTIHRAADWRKEVFLKGDYKRLRYRGNFSVSYYGGDKKVAYFSSFYEHILRRANRTVEYPIPYLTQNKQMAADIGNAAFLWGSRFHKEWRMLCHLKRLDDYQWHSTPEENLEYVKYWVEPKYHAFMGSEDLFKDTFRKLLNRWVGDNLLYTKSVLTIDEYASNPTLWAGSGSGYWPKESWPDDLKGVSKTKWVRAWTLPSWKVCAALRDYIAFEHKIQQKPEVAKTRLVAGADLPSYLKMKFVWDSCLKKCLRGWKDTPINMSSIEKWNMWRKLSKFNTGWRAPVDQAEFDIYQSKWCVLEIFRQLGEFFISHGEMEVGDVMKSIIYGLEHATVYEPTSGVTVPYENGVLSGWYFTAFIDTVLNEVSFKMVLELCNNLGIPYEIGYSYHQGDDVQANIMGDGLLSRISLLYSSLGFKVNSAKFFISRERDEFLRRIISPNHIFGYPARSIVNILTSSPERTIDEVMSISSRFAQWKKLSDRLEVELWRMPIISDLCGMLKASSDNIVRWIRTPKTLGGGGMNTNDLGMGDYVRVVEKKTGVDGAIRIPKSIFSGMKNFYSRWGIERQPFDGTIAAKSQKFKKEMSFERFTAKTSKEAVRAWPFTLDGDLMELDRPVFPKWPASIGDTLGPFQHEVPPENNMQLRIYSGFTRKLREAVMERRLSVAAPCIKGYSEEYVSTITGCFLGRILRLLTFKHRATMADFTRMSLRVEGSGIRGDYLSSE